MKPFNHPLVLNDNNNISTQASHKIKTE